MHGGEETSLRKAVPLERPEATQNHHARHHGAGINFRGPTHSCQLSCPQGQVPIACPSTARKPTFSEEYFGGANNFAPKYLAVGNSPSPVCRWLRNQVIAKNIPGGANNVAPKYLAQELLPCQALPTQQTSPQLKYQGIVKHVSYHIYNMLRIILSTGVLSLAMLIRHSHITWRDAN